MFDTFKKCFSIFLFLGISLNTFCRVCNILEYGAKPDGTTVNTQAIQAAIDSAAKAGGGRVVVPAGIFLTGSVFLKDNIELNLAEGAVLLGSLSFSDYRKNTRWYALILAKDANSVSITGKGAIDGQGGQLALNIDNLIKTGVLKDPNYTIDRKRPSENVRPQLIEFLNCRKVALRDISLKNAACWVQTYHNCMDMKFDNIRVESTAFWNNDGIDLSDCKNVTISNSFINSADDGICLKSHERGLACENISIENCTIRSSASAVKLGTASYGGFKNITIKNIHVYDTYRSAIALESVDGGSIENIDISDVTAQNTGNAIFLRLGQRNKNAEPGCLRNIHIKKIKAEVPNAVPDAGYNIAGPPLKEPHNLIPSSIAGLPDRKIENVVLEDIEILFGGGAKKEAAYIPLDSLQNVPECRNDYPEFSMFGELPACGFYVRHTQGLTMKNIVIKIIDLDFRPALVFDDVSSLFLDNISICPTNSESQVILNNVHNAAIKNSNIPKDIRDFVKVQGGSTGIEK